MKIIVVDTDRDTSALVAFALRQDGHLALEIADLAAVLAAIAREEPCVVVMAAQPGGRMSFELCQAIRARSAARSADQWPGYRGGRGGSAGPWR